VSEKTSVQYDIKDETLAAAGSLRIQWAAREMPVLRLIGERFAKEQPLKGIRISACLHVTTETANLALALKACLAVEHGIPVFAMKGEDNDTYYKHINAALDHAPHITMDDGADLVAAIHKDRGEVLDSIIGGTEETTTGVIRLKSLESAQKLKYPIIAVNDAQTKHFFDNRYGTGQSTIDGITRATNILWAGRQVVICGYGWCGRGAAMRANGLGAHVIICEVEPIRALEAVMDGFRVMPLVEAAKIGDLFITVTGGLNIIDRQHMLELKDGAILANSGHFNAEINIPALESLSSDKKAVRPFVDQYTLENGKSVFLLGEGRLINLTAAEGHPASVMDMSFANQALCSEHVVKQGREFVPKVYPVPIEVDNTVGWLKLNAMGIGIDTLTPEQKRYQESWEMGT